MTCAGKLVRDVFGLSRPDAAMVNRDSYLIIASLIIRSVTDAEKLSTADLTALSKALAEQRRLELSRMEIERRFPRADPAPDNLKTEASRPLPQGFGNVVEQIYGTNLSKPPDDNDTGEQ